jgi:hypothetical protein
MSPTVSLGNGDPHLEEYPMLNSRMRLGLAGLSFLVASFILISALKSPNMTAVSAKAQNNERKLENLIPKHVPLSIRIKKEKEKAFKDLENEKWASDFELEVTNTGTKPIYEFYLNLILDVKNSAYRNVMAEVYYGRVELGDHRVLARPDDIPLKPGETCTLKIHPGVVSAWEKIRREEGRPLPKLIQVEFQLLSFGDGTGFVGDTAVPVPRKLEEIRNCTPQQNKGDPRNLDWRRGGVLAFDTAAKNDLPARFLPVNFLGKDNSKTAPASIVDDSCCPTGCTAIVAYTELACYNCPIQNRFYSSTCSNAEAVCAAPSFDTKECTIPETGETYLCLKIDIHVCNGLPAGTPTPTPSPTPESCQVYCTDAGALRGADDCKYPFPFNGCPAFEIRRGDCCYQGECPSPFPTPPECPDGWTTPGYYGYPICKWGNCLPPNPTAQEQCEALGYYWNFASNTCHSTPQTQVQCATADWYWNFTNSTCPSTPAVGMCGGGPDWGNYPSSGCFTSGLGIFAGICDRSTAFKSNCFQYDGDYDPHYCVCTGCDSCGGSPILIDEPGGFDLTDVNHGVRFDLNGNGTPDRLSWTRPSSTGSWLALDLNRNGMIDSGKELFGNFTFQTEPPEGVGKNGFRALAEYDKPENGGNADGVIDNRDAVFAKLLLWRDINHNGISEPDELRPLSASGVEAMSLDYKESRRRDRFGNQFRYRAKIYGANHHELARWAWDVFLLSSQ